MGALLGTLVGIVLVARPSALFGEDANGGTDPLGVLFALSSAIAAGLAIVLIRKVGFLFFKAIVLIREV